MEEKVRKMEKKKVERKEIIEITEINKLTNTSITELLNKNFVKKLESLKEGKIFPIAVVLIGLKDKKIAPLILTHSNPEDVEKRILGIGSPDRELLEKVKSIIKKM